MKYFSKAGLYKASNVLFDPVKIEARSYGWWIFVAYIGGRVVFNDYPYSNTTRRHQQKVRQLMQSLGIHIDVYIAAPRGLQDLESAFTYYSAQIKALQNEILQPRTHRKKNEERAKQIQQLEDKLHTISRMIETDKLGLGAA